MPKHGSCPEGYRWKNGRCVKEAGSSGIPELPSQLEKLELPVKPEKLTNKGLVLDHGALHLAWRALEGGRRPKLDGALRSRPDILSAHALIVDELKERGLAHPQAIRGTEELDRRSQKLEAQAEEQKAAERESLVIQTLIFSKAKFPKAEVAQAWAREHGFEAGKVDEKPDSWRLRQREPELFDAESFRSFSIPRGSPKSGVVAVGGKLLKAEEAKPEPEPKKPEPEAKLEAEGEKLEKAEHSRVKIVRRKPLGGLVLIGPRLYRVRRDGDKKAEGSGSKVVLVEKQRGFGETLMGAPRGTFDVSIVEPASGPPEAVAKDWLGHRVWVGLDRGEEALGATYIEPQELLLALLDLPELKPASAKA